MKTLKYILPILLLITVVFSCSEDEFGNTNFVDSILAPTNVVAEFNITQDNTGLVTITPNSQGAVNYDIYLGDDTVEPVKVKQGENISHVYAEGNYDVKVVATGVSGLKTEIIQPLVVSFKAPENLVVEITNDEATSKQVNVKATADYATMFEVYFGEEGNDDPVSGNIGETVSYVYAEPGVYTIKVVAKGAAIETHEYSVEFEVTEILQPIEKAPTPRNRNEADVVSIFSDVYSNITVTEWNPGWGQSTVLSPFDVDGDNILKYDYLNYTGIVTDYGNPTDVSAMEYIHFDYWTNDAESIGFKIVNTNQPDGSPEKEYEVTISEITAGAWVSVDIPLSEFTTDMSAITQMLFVSNGVTVFIDNLYFWKEATGNPAAGVLPINFESPYELSSFDGGDISIIDNPDTNGNSSAKVLQLVKGAGQTWAGSKITVDTPFGIEESVTVNAKVWSPRAGLKLLMKYEDATPWPNTQATAEIVAETTTSNAWEELSFTLTGVDPNIDYYNLVLIMDNGTAGDGSSDYTIYVDDISVASFLDFEPELEISSFDGGEISIVNNPDTNGNSSLKVAKLVKGAGQTWAGSKITVDTPFGIEESITIRAKVWSPRAGLKLLMKFEDATPWPNTQATAEIVAETTTSNTWEELSFTLTGVDPNVDYYNMVLIMDNGTAGDGSSDYTIYIDDIVKN